MNRGEGKMDINDFVINTEDSKISVREIFNKIKQGEIITDPDYQRNYIYDEDKASSVIESIMIGIPIPPIYTSENYNEVAEVIDGVQRLTSIVNLENSAIIGVTPTYINSRVSKNVIFLIIKKLSN
jgi:uncharacterized protein with ParB-like and HNH nuclease domain